MTRFVTFQDAYEHLLIVFDQEQKDSGSQGRRIRIAIQTAYQRLPALHKWAYFLGSGSLNTSTPDTHTITYVAATGLATTTGIWDADAIYGAITISNTRYEIQRRISDTVVELKDGPAADYSGSTRWQRFRYPLPSDVGDVRNVVDPAQYFDIRRVYVDQTWWWQQVINAETYPLVWALYPSEESPTNWEIWLSGSGETQRSLKYLYQKRTTDLNVLEVQNATGATVSITGDVATFSTGVLTSNMVGAVLRVSSTGDHPTGYLPRKERDSVQGTYSEVNNPPASEHIITAVNSATEAIIRTPTATVVAKGYSISSRIDLTPGPMIELFYRLAEEQWDIISRAEPPVLKESSRRSQMALRRAMIADGRGHSDARISSVMRGDVIEES